MRWYVIVSKVKVVEKKFNAKSEFAFEPNYNVSAGAKAPIITSKNPQKIQLSHFGFTPAFAPKRTYLLNARAEGDHNLDNRSDFTGAKGIIKNPYFRKAIRSQRCLVIADAFIEGTTANKLNEPYLVYLNNIFNDTSDLAESQLIVYPVFAYAPETSWEIGFSSLYVYFANQDTTNRLSEINGFTFFTLENQYGLFFDHAIYSDQSRWFFLGKLRFQSFPLFYHGIGIKSPEQALAKVQANQILIKERVLRKLRKDLFVGFEFDYQRLSSVDFELTESTNPNLELPRGSNGSDNIGLGLGFVRDNRHNVLNVRKGFFSELALLHYNPAWGSTFKFTSIISDTRFFKPMGKNNVLATQVLGQFNFGDVPFNQLALLGGESMMRGYYYGRYRDNNQVAAQVEYRFLPIPFNFTKRIGAAVFGGTASVFDEVNNLGVSNFVVSGGAGLRFLLFPKKDIWIRTDLAFTREGRGFYIFIGESF